MSDIKTNKNKVLQISKIYKPIKRSVQCSVA